MTADQLKRDDGFGELGSDDTGCNILHVDMDAFFAEVELRDRPELRGRPLIIGGAKGRGVVATASYEARAFGVHSAMPMSQALRACPQAVVLAPSGKYGQASREVMAILREMTPEVEQVSVDEAFLDVSGARRAVGSPAHIAREIRRRVADELGLPCSVGVATVTMVAKIASTSAKPNGLLVVPAASTRQFLHAMKVQRLWGVGATTAKALAAIGVYTVADLAELAPSTLINAVGKVGAARLTALAAGQETRGLHASVAEKSISTERTFPTDISDVGTLRAQLRAEVEATTRRLRRAELVATTVSVKLRFSDFTTLERSRSLSAPSASASEIGESASRLLDKLDPGGRAVRLIGVRVSGLVPLRDVGQQLTLDTETQVRTAAEQVMDDVIDRFGSTAVSRASLMGRTDRNS